jgi:hypothetical protein
MRKAKHDPVTGTLRTPRGTPRICSGTLAAFFPGTVPVAGRSARFSCPARTCSGTVYIYQVGQHLGVVRTVTTIRFRGLGATGLNRSGRAYPLARGRRARPKERRSEPPARIVEIALSAMCTVPRANTIWPGRG